MRLTISRATSVLLSSALAVTMSLGGLLITAAPASAVPTTNVTVTSSGPLTAGQPNAAPIIVTYTAPTALPGDTNNSSIARLNGATWVTNANFQCGSMVTVSADQGLSANCVASGAADAYAQGSTAGAANWPANVTWVFTFAANTVIMPNAPALMVETGTFVATQGGANYDNGLTSVALTGYVAPASTVTFNANGGTGAIADQVASAATPLTANVFSRSGFTFAGWNTAADGTGTAYADGASFDFAASTTLYAQWTPVLALTGIDAAGYAGSVSALLLVGVGLISLRAVSRKRDLSS